jgi:drug/metabolite transporter (DMT)-like permease
MPGGNLQGLALFSQFVPVALCFALTVVAVAAFVQFCAMYRFRIGGWAGVCLAVVFYAFVTLAGVMFEQRSNTPALLNPLYYADVVTQGDLYMDSEFRVLRSEEDDSAYGHKSSFFPGNTSGVSAPFSPGAQLVTFHQPDAHAADARSQGLVLEGVLAFLCAGLAYVKWGRTREEMLRDESRSQ